MTLWDKFLRRSKFDEVIEWMGTGPTAVLEISIANIGSKKDSIRVVLFRIRHPDPSLAWLELEIEHFRRVFPAVLDVDVFAPRIEIELEHTPPRIRNALIDGEAQILVVNARNRETLFQVPAQGGGPPPPTLEDLGARNEND